jgi:acetyltransferase-like isoleucine patch superfamily enzyme
MKLSDGPEFIWQGIIAAVRSNDSRLAAWLRQKIYRTTCRIDTEVFITNRNNFHAGRGCWLYHGCYILNHHGYITMGNDSHLGAFCYVNVCHGEVRIGDDVAVGPGTKIIAFSNHYAQGKKVTEERRTGDIVIGNNVLIGANCTILPGTTIQDNVVVAAGAVARGVLECDSIYGGVPCQRLKAGWHGDSSSQPV